MIRKRASQLISRFFFAGVGRNYKEPTLENFKQHTAFNMQISFISPRNISLNDLNTEEQRRRTVKKIIDEYYFMGVTERMDESLIALQFILGLDTGDILHVSSKVNRRHNNRRCHGICNKILLSTLTEEMKTLTLFEEFN